MTGKHIVKISNKRLSFELEINRKVTVIKGNSGTGKTTLISMLLGYITEGRVSGSTLYSDLEVKVLTPTSRWSLDLSESKNTVFFVDENVRYIYQKAFQEEFAVSDNYIVVVSRSGLFSHLPYAIKSVYELRSEKTKNGYLTRMYNLYEDNLLNVSPDLVITEDSNSGKDMMESIFPCSVMSAKGNGNVSNLVLEQIKFNKTIYVIVDGAAFGGFIQKLLSICENYDVYVFAPESFEYMLLMTETFNRYLSDELVATWNYCDISKYLTWEGYYTDLLTGLCEEKYRFTYSKSKLNAFFLSDSFKVSIRAQLKDIVGFS